MTTYNPQNSLYCSPVNNNGYDPIQGFDVQLWVQDVCTGKIAWVGQFQSITLSVRNATESYLEMGQRIPIHLDGEIQIAFVLEQGMVDFNFLERTFGVPTIRRDSYLTRGPRFQISFDVNAPELDNAAQFTNNGLYERSNTNTSSGLSPQQIITSPSNQSLYRFGSDESFSFDSDSYVGGNSRPKASGRMDLHRCKVDTVSMGARPGRSVVALRWEGLAEGATYVPQSIQAFKTERFKQNAASGGGFLNSPQVNINDATDVRLR